MNRSAFRDPRSAFLLLFFLLSCVPHSTFAGPAVPLQGTKAVASAGTPVALVSTETFVNAVEIHARKNLTTANTGVIYLGFSSSAGQNYRVLAPGESFSFTMPEGKKMDLRKFYLDAATNGDAVTWTAVVAQ